MGLLVESIPWLTLLFAASMYPLGIMLGSSCSPCCGGCDEVIDFVRCIRAVRVTKQPAPAINRRTASVSSPGQVGASYNISTGKWQMRFVFPNWTTSATTITDSDAVESFLRGESTLEMTLDGDLWEVSADAATAYCGAMLCPATLGGGNIYSSAWLFNSGVLPRVVTYTSPSPQASITSYSSSGTTTYQNLCYSQEQRRTFVLKPNSSDYCSYQGFYSFCDNALAATGALDSSGNYIGERANLGGSVSVQSFFCAVDILSAIEEGPCRSVVSGSSLDDYYTLGGDENASAPVGSCPSGLVLGGNVCIPAEATISYAQSQSVYGGLTPRPPVGTIAAGDYVLAAATSGVYAPQGSFLAVNCNSHVFVGQMPVDPSPSAWTTPPSSLQVIVHRQRQKWCDAFPTAPAGQFSGGIATWYGSGSFFSGNGCFYGLVQSFCAGNVGEYSFGAIQQAVPLTITATPSTVPSSGGQVVVSYCCPQQTQTHTIPANSDRVPRTFAIRSGTETVFVNQQASTACRFGVAWKNSGGQFSFPLPGANASATVWMPSSACPLIGVIYPAHADGVGMGASVCDWTATTPVDWLTLSKSPDGGLLYVEVNKDSTTPYTQDRSAVVTISSSGNTQQWTVVQKAP